MRFVPHRAPRRRVALLLAAFACGATPGLGQSKPPKKSKAAAPRDPERTVHIAVVQVGQNHYAQGNPGTETNFKVLETQARAAAASQPRPDVICFPEFALSGWPYPSEGEINGLAEKIPGDGPWYRRYRELARGTGVGLLGAFVELDGDRRYNTACLIDGKGEFRGKYRKVHTTLGEQAWWGWGKGNRFSPIELDGVRYGISICADMCFPETVRCQELMGADVILHQSIGDDMGPLLPARAIDSKMPIALAIFQGGSYAVDPDGNVMGKLPAETPGWKTFAVQPFKPHLGTKYSGLYDTRKGDFNLRCPPAYAALVDPALRPPWTEVFLDRQGRPQSREEILKRFHGHYDGDESPASKRAATAPGP